MSADCFHAGLVALAVTLHTGTLILPLFLLFFNTLCVVYMNHNGKKVGN